MKLFFQTAKFISILLLAVACAANYRATAQSSGKDDIFQMPEGMVTEGIPQIMNSEVEHLFYDQSALKSNLIWDTDKTNRKLFVTDETNNVYYVAAPLVPPVKLTEKVVPVSVKAHPAGKFIAYNFDSERNDRYQLYVFDITAKQQRQLTNFTGDKAVESIVWSADGKFIYYTLIDYEKKLAQLCRHNLTTQFCYPIQLQGIWNVLDIKQEEVLLKYWKASSSQFLYLYNIQSNQLKPIDETGNSTEGFFAQRNIFWLSDGAGGECQKMPCILRRKIKGGVKVKPLRLPENLQNLDGIKVSPDGKHLLIQESADGADNLRIFELKKGNLQNEVTGFIPSAYAIWNTRWLSNEEVIYTLENIGTPASIHSYNIKSKQITIWTKERIPAQLDGKIQKPEILRWQSFDQKTITGFIVRPQKMPQKSPVLIYVHGGPQIVDKPVFNSQDIRLASNLGMTIIHTNIRGSSSFGTEFMNADNKEKREDAVKDIQTLIDWIEKQPDLDKDNIFLRGQSYGGFVVLSAALREPKRVKAVIAEYPLISIREYLAQSWIDDFLKVEFGDPKDEALMSKLDALTPLNNVEKWNNIPLLLTRGKQDTRTPEKDVVDLKNQLQTKGSPVWYIYSSTAGHGVGGKYVFAAIYKFLKTNMKS